MYNSSSLSRAPDAGRFGLAGHAEPRVMDPKDRIAAWKRWEMTSFAEGLPALARQSEVSRPAPVEKVARISDAEMDTLRLEARMAGEKAGHQEGYDKGHALGHAEGHAAAMAAVHEQARQLKALAQALPTALRVADASVADDLLALAMDLARQVLGQTLSVDPQAMLSVVRDLLQAEPALIGTPQLFLHPDDAALVGEHLSGDLQTAGWRIRSDAAIQRGGCRVTANSGERDANLESRWARVAASLAKHTPVAKGLAP